MLGFLAFALTLAGAALFYLGFRRQRWRKSPLSRRVAMPTSMLLLALALAGWIQATRPDTGTFIFLVLLMLLWAAFPFVGLYARGRQ